MISYVGITKNNFPTKR